jgi:hypothetical protein
MSISKRLRYEILRRDNYACRYCGRAAPDVKLTVDHVVPESLGGSSDDPANLVAACEDCNNGKSSSNPDAPLVADVSADAIRWAKAMASAGQILLGDRSRRELLRGRFVEAWNRWTYKDWKTGQQVHVPLEGDWAGSVDMILAAGLPIEILCDCVDLAMGRKGVTDEFRYMCGIAWKKVNQLRQIAGEIIEAETAECGQPPPVSQVLTEQARIARQPDD